jgi:pimeloyl-ACP methyl ester carboxylesterase
MLRIFKWVVLGTLGFLALAVAAALGGSQLSLDRKGAHRSATEQLPAFTGFGEKAQVRIPARGMEFRARIAGHTGPGVILLHGFPTTSAMYEPLIDAAAAAGHRVVAFDQRGYSPGARPENVADYTVPDLTADVLAIADAVGFDRFHLVGHDWGSAIGWSVVLRHPERVLTWTGLSIAHPIAFRSALQGDPDQQQRSSYFRLFTTPWVPETMMTFNGLWLLRENYAVMSPAERDEYLRVFAEPGALTAGLNWYRATLSSGDLPIEGVPTDVLRPTLFIWGNADPSVGRAAVEAQRAYMKAPYEVIELDAGHWLIEENRGRVVPEILAHWAEHTAQAQPGEDQSRSGAPGGNSGR